MSKLPLNRLTTRLTAQMLTYYFNGIVDAKITQEFIHYYQTSGRSYLTENTTTQMRAKSLLEAGDPHSVDYLIGLAFTMYRTNGYGNYIMGVRMERALKSRYHAQISAMLADYCHRLEAELEVYHNYQEEKDGWLPFFGFWLENSMVTFRQAKKFAQEKFGYEGKLDKYQIVRACLTVQRQNSAHNLDVARRILANEAQGDIKIDLLNQASQEVELSDVFLKSCALTQRIQANSDKALIGLLKVRFPRAFIKTPRLRSLGKN